MLPTPRDGIREDHAEPFVYKNELQSLTQKTRDKLQTLTEIADSIVSVEEEETQVKEELNCIILEGDKEHGPLAERLVTLDDQYKFLTKLEQELMDIRKKGNIITYEKGGNIENTRHISLDARERVRKSKRQPEHSTHGSPVHAV